MQNGHRNNVPPGSGRAHGMAIGSAVGDALGMPVEFCPKFPRLDEMVPGRLPAGSFTDDTEQAIALAQSLAATGGVFDASDFDERLLDWWHRRPMDVGNHTADVLHSYRDFSSLAEAAKRIQERRPDSEGNGSIMRLWPCALVRRDHVAECARLQSLATHASNTCVEACVLLAECLADLVRGGDLDELIQPLAEWVGDPLTRKWNSGWVRDTMAVAVWAATTTDNFTDCVVEAVNVPGDTDTGGAVAGMIAGAAYGLDAIPAEWRAELGAPIPVCSDTIWREAEILKLVDEVMAA